MWKSNCHASDHLRKIRPTRPKSRWNPAKPIHNELAHLITRLPCELFVELWRILDVHWISFGKSAPFRGSLIRMIRAECDRQEPTLYSCLIPSDQVSRDRQEQRARMAGTCATDGENGARVYVQPHSLHADVKIEARSSICIGIC